MIYFKKIKMIKAGKLFLMLFILLFSFCKGQQQKNILIDSIKLSNLTDSNFDNHFVSRGFVNFRYAAKKTTPVIVHIQSTIPYKLQQKDEDFFGGLFLEKIFPDDKIDSYFDVVSASGVLLSDDGYIVTTNHLIDHSVRLKVTLNNQRSYNAKIIGSDPLTDLALIKIDAFDLPFIELGNSDSVEVGDFVLAVGNPFNLTSTVTAGMISAKAKNINILKKQGAIESYLQTNAVLNRGNSGGALVDVDGKLIGVNTAIANPFGIYAGYSFAVPVNMVKKVVNDLQLYRKVIRGYLGAFISDLNDDLINELNLKNTTGVYVDSLVNDGAAIIAGIKNEDIITGIDNHEIESTNQLKEILSTYSPGDKIKLIYFRKGIPNRINVILKAKEEKQTALLSNDQILKKLGIGIEDISKSEKEKLKIAGGLKVTDINLGLVDEYTNMKKGFIITSINAIEIKNSESLFKAMDGKFGKIIFGGVYLDDEGVYYYGINVQ